MRDERGERRDERGERGEGRGERREERGERREERGERRDRERKDLQEQKSCKKIIDNSVFSLQCNKFKEIKAGDHFTIFLKVKKILINSKTKPLLYYQKKILTF